MNETKKPKDTWEKVAILSKVSIPIVVVIVGAILNSTLKQRELRADYVKLAVGVLQNADTAQGLRELRKWAVRVLDELGPVKLTPELRRAFEQGDLQLPAHALMYSPWEGEISGARLGVTSAPRVGLTVKVNDEVMGLTPVTVVLHPGPARIDWLSQNGGRVCGIQIIIEPGDVVRLSCNTESGMVVERR